MRVLAFTRYDLEAASTRYRLQRFFFPRSLRRGSRLSGTRRSAIDNEAAGRGRGGTGSGVGAAFARRLATLAAARKPDRSGFSKVMRLIRCPASAMSTRYASTWLNPKGSVSPSYER